MVSVEDLVKVREAVCKTTYLIEQCDTSEEVAEAVIYE